MPRTLTISLAVLFAAVAAIASAVPAPAAPAAQPLTRIYRGDDGGALYLRQIGNAVYGFGEHPGRKYAYVLKGTVAGDRITGSWRDVPKGTRSNYGTLDLRWSLAGARIDRAGGGDLGPETFTAIPPDGIPWPNMQAAGFQAGKTSDLDGAFVGDDGSRHYVRELPDKTVAWVAERPMQPSERPGWVSVFVGTRTGSGFGGSFADVPKGIEQRSGSFGAALIGSKRELMLKQVGAERTHRLAPDYALDWDVFANTIKAKLDGRVFGYAFAIGHNGGILRSGAGGLRRAAFDGGKLPFTTHTQAQTASAAKLITATAIVKALHERGLTVDAKVTPFLPSCLKRAGNISSLTFRELLNHTSGLSGARDTPAAGSCNGQDPYQCLLDLLKQGRVASRDYHYNNKAYDLMRFLVPLVSDTTGTKGQFELLDCENTANVLHRKIAERFARYVLDEVLAPAGATASWYPGGDYSLNYRCERTVVWCEPKQRGFAPGLDSILRSGSGKMAISVLDYVRFLRALEHGEIVPKSLVDGMKGTPGNRLGFDTRYEGRAGDYHWKNGGCPDLEGKDRGCSTVAMVFPGDTQAYVAINSSNNAYSGKLTDIVGAAFDKALR